MEIGIEQQSSTHMKSLAWWCK